MTEDHDIPWLDPEHDSNYEPITDLMDDEHDDGFHEACGHFHGTVECPDPNKACGDYRCCIN